MSDETPEAIKELISINQWVAYDADKIPIGPTGHRASSTNPKTWGTLAQAKHIRRVNMLRGVGFTFSKGDPYVGIDLDNAFCEDTGQLKPHAKEIVDKLNSYTEVSPSGNGLHIWVRGSLPRDGAHTKIEGCSVEVYQAGRYFTVTGQPFVDTPRTIEDRQDQLGTWFDATFTTFARAMPIDGLTWESPEAETWIPDALAVLSPDMEEPEWRQVGAAIKSELGDSGFHLWDAWSAGSPKYGGTAACQRKWDSIDETRWTIATLVWMAKQEGYTVPTGELLAPDWVRDSMHKMFANSPLRDSPDEARGMSLELFDVFDLITDDSPYEPDIIGPGVLSAGDLMLVFGPPKSMKTLCVMSMCLNFGLGLPFLGMRPAKPLRTLMAQFEIKRDNMRRRVKLLSKHFSDEQRGDLAGMIHVTDRFTPRLSADFIEEFSTLAHQASDEGFDLLVIDPLSNIFTGESENDNTQMSAFLRAIRALRNAINPELAVILVHHANKVRRDDRSAEPFNALRGASSLRGSYDAGMYLDRVDETSGNLMVFWELRNGPGMPTTTIKFDDGEFVEISDETRYQVQCKIQEDADDGVARSKSSFVAAHHGEYGMAEPAFGQLLSDMLKDGELVLWKPDAQHNTELPKRSKGLIGVPGMLFNGFAVTATEV